MKPTFTLTGDATDFLTHYWQKRPLVLRQAADGLDVISAQELAGLALEDACESRLIEGAGNGPWRVRNGPFQEHDFKTLPDTNWTLLVQSVDHYLTEVSLLLDSFSFVPGWRLEDIMISYAVTGGSVGPHYDHYDVFLIQAKGTRRWHIGPVCDAHSPCQPNADLRLLADMPVEETWRVEAGDVLYLPPGVAHWGIAEDDDCITWSVGFRAPRLSDVLAAITDEALEHADPEQLYRDPVLADTMPSGTPPPGQLSGTALQHLYQQACSLVDTGVLASALGRFLSEPRQDSLDFAIDTGTIRALEPAAHLVRHGGARLLVTSDDASPNAPGTLWVNGEAITVPAHCMDLAHYLASTRLYYTSRQALASTSPEHSALMEELINKGVLCPL